MSTMRSCAALALAALLAAGCEKPPPRQRSLTAGGLAASVQMAPETARLLDTAAEVLSGNLGRNQRTLDAGNPDSDLGRINLVAGKVRWPLSADLHRLLQLAQYYAALTGGAFDLTTDPVAAQWGLAGGEVPREPPGSDLIAAAMGGVGFENVKLFDDRAIAFTSTRTRLNARPLVPAYALDTGIVQLRRMKVPHVLLRAGAAARCLGTDEGGAPWRVPLTDPSAPGVRYGDILLADGRAAAASFLYEQSVEIGGRRYGGIIDPRSGMPAQGTRAAAVIGPLALQAAALAQALVVLGHEGKEVLAQFPRCDVLVVRDTEPPELWMTPGFARRFEVNSSFRAQVRDLERPAVETPAGSAPPPAEPPE